MDSNGVKITRAHFGTLPGGFEVSKYTLQNQNGLILSVMPFGAAITELYMPDRQGNFDNIVLGYDMLEDYVNDPHNFGGNLGRVANRIAYGKFTLNDKK